jgi:hypothetical protein
MAEPIHNIAVISFPRTASKTLTTWYANKFDKIAAHGILHNPEYHGANDYTYPNMKRRVFECTHVLHGHWHSLNLLDKDIINFIKDNYKIVSAHRESKLVFESLNEITNKPELIAELIEKTNAEKANWDIWKHHLIDGDISTIDAPGPDSTLI